MEILWINGEFKPLSEGTVPIEDRSLLFSDGIYEVIAAYNGRPVLLEEHLDRWERSAAGLRIPQIYSREARSEVLHELIRRSGKQNVMLYGQLSRGTGRRAHQFPAKPAPIEFWFVRDFPSYKPEFFTQGVPVYTHPDERWKHCWIKSVSLLPNCMAKQFATEKGGFEAILVADDGTVKEGAVANFHVVKDGAIVTHPLDGSILGGVKRMFMLEAARELGIAVREEKYSHDFLRKADEAFLTSTTINVLPVTKCDDRPVGNGQVGPVTQALLAWMKKEIAARTEQVGV